MTEILCELLDGNLFEVDINEPGFLFAGRLTATETGRSWRFVYRSPLVRDTDRMYLPVLAWLDGAAPIGEARSYEDELMMHGTGELSLWEP